MDKAIVKAAIDAIRKEMRSRLGAKLTPPPIPEDAIPEKTHHVAVIMEGSPEEEAGESPAEAASEGDTETSGLKGAIADAIAKKKKTK